MVTEYSWPPPPPIMALTSNEVHVWRVSLEQPTTYIQALEQTLSPDERSRAKRFHFERDRRYFIVGRGTLRVILSRYLGVEPGNLEFRYGPRGKPSLSGILSKSTLRFNLAHSHELALYALTRNHEVGVDLEHIHPMPDAEEIAARFFSASENRALQALPTTKRLEAFFNCWTRKEAYVKALGDGLSQPLDQFVVSLAPGEPARLLNVEGNPKAITRWSLEALSPFPGYVAALAVEGSSWRLKCWQYSPPQIVGVTEPAPHYLEHPPKLT